MKGNKQMFSPHLDPPPRKGEEVCIPRVTLRQPGNFSASFRRRPAGCGGQAELKILVFHTGTPTPRYSDTSQRPHLAPYLSYGLEFQT